jgi:hypothetical protein
MFALAAISHAVVSWPPRDAQHVVSVAHIPVAVVVPPLLPPEPPLLVEAGLHSLAHVVLAEHWLPPLDDDVDETCEMQVMHAGVSSCVQVE